MLSKPNFSAQVFEPEPRLVPSPVLFVLRNEPKGEIIREKQRRYLLETIIVANLLPVVAGIR